MTDSLGLGDSAEVKIAVIQEQIKGIREQQKVHAETTAANFVKQDANFSLIFSALKEINISMSRGNGVFVACLAFSGAIGAAISWAVTLYAGKHS